MDGDGGQQRQLVTRIRWLPLTLCTAAGVLLIWRTFAIAGAGKAEDVLLSLLVEASAALVLLAVFFLLERSFTRQATRTIVRQVREQVVAPFEQRLAGLSTRIDELQHTVDDQNAQQRARHHDLVTAMDEVSFDTVSQALAEASRLRAITGGAVRVQAHPDPAGIWLDFSFGAIFVKGQRSGDDVIRITAHPGGDSQPFGYLYEDWVADEGIAEVAGRLRDRLRRNGNHQLVNRPAWGLAMRNLQRALAVTLPDGAKIAGPLHRLVGELAVTDRGIEHLDGRLLIAVADFPEPPAAAELLGRAGPTATGWDPPCPDDVDIADWQVVTAAARRLIGGVHRLYIDPGTGPTWVPKGIGHNS